jgi:hypothetical protein
MNRLKTSENIDQEKHKVGLLHDSGGRAIAWQVQGPKFKPQY